MAGKAAPTPSIKLTKGLERLMADKDLMARIAAVEEDILKVIAVVQLDAVNEENRSNAGEMVYAMKRVIDTVEHLAIGGRAYNAEREKI